MRKVTVFFVLCGFIIGVGQLKADQINAPVPYNPESTASPACINRLSQYHSILDSFFLSVPAASTMKRNDVIIPFIQTDSVFTPLLPGKKVIKYQVVGSYIQSADKKYYSRAETDDKDIDTRVSWSGPEISVYIDQDFDGVCTGAAEEDSNYFTVSYYDSVNQQSFSIALLQAYANPGTPILLSDFCSDPNATLASKIQSAVVSAWDQSTSGGPAVTNQDKEDFRARVVSQIKPGATIAALCSAWGS